MELLTQSDEISLYPTLEKNWSPPVVLDRLSIPQGQIVVVREDLLAGGTKQRGLLPYLKDLYASGVREVVYASPFCGFAQVALAVSAAALKLPVTLFCEQDLQGDLHAFSQMAKAFGARTHLVKTLGEADQETKRYAEKSEFIFEIPLGLCDPRYLTHMRNKLGEQYELIQQILRVYPKRIWLPVGSGTLAKIFTEIVSEDCELLCVDVRVLPPTDARIEGLLNRPNLTLYRTPELFHQTSETIPPIPSNIHYDAKLWLWITTEGQDGDLWWNVAR